jgi:hypothetical protein
MEPFSTIVSDDIRYLGVESYEIWWENLVKMYEWFDCVLCTVISKVMILDRRGNGFKIGWAEIFVGKITKDSVDLGSMFNFHDVFLVVWHCL